MAQVRCDLRDILAKRVETFRFDLLKRAFADDQSGLKIIAPVDQDQRLAVIDVAQYLLWVVRLARDSKPQHIKGTAELLNTESRGVPHRRTPTVAGNHQVRFNL